MVDTNYYEILELEPSSTADEIRAAYFRLSKLLHPDLKGNQALFRLVKEAYETLSNPARREAYDRNGYVDKQTQSSNASAPGWRRTDDKPPKKPGPKADPTSNSHDESSDEPPPPRSPPPPPTRDQSATRSDRETVVTSGSLRKRVDANPSWALLTAGVLIIVVGGRSLLFLGFGAAVVGFVGVLGRKKAVRRADHDPGPARTGGTLLADELKAGAPTALKGGFTVVLSVLAASAARPKSRRKRRR
jgi:hypothetical protein